MIIVFFRTLLVYALLLLTMRLLGKRQLGEMELSEFVVAALTADLAAIPLQDIGIPMLNGLIPILTLFCLELLVAGLSMKSIRLRRLLFGTPSILIEKGVILQRELRRNRFTLDELMQELRSQGVTDLSKIELAVLETDGRLNVLLFPAENPVTPSQLGIEVQDIGAPITVVCDGRILAANLRHAGYDEAWLADCLRNHGYRSAEEVFLLSVNEAGQVYLAGKEERE